MIIVKVTTCVFINVVLQSLPCKVNEEASLQISNNRTDAAILC